MARRSLGPAATDPNQVLTRAEVQALIAAAGGGGGGAGVLPVPSAQVGEWTSWGTAGVGGRTFSAGELNLMALYLPAGTFDELALQVESAATGATVRAVVYGDTSADKPGALLYASPAVDASTTGGKRITGVTGVSLTSPGRLWVGAVPQGANLNLTGSNSTAMQYVRNSTPGADLFFQPPPAWRITGVTGTPPSSAAAAVRGEQAARVLIRRAS